MVSPLAGFHGHGTCPRCHRIIRLTIQGKLWGHYTKARTQAGGFREGAVSCAGGWQKPEAA